LPVARVDVIRVRVETCAVLRTDHIVEMDDLDASPAQSAYEGRVFLCEAFAIRYGAEQESALELERRDVREPVEGACSWPGRGQAHGVVSLHALRPPPRVAQPLPETMP